MRDRLIELIIQADNKCANTISCGECEHCGKGEECINHNIADHLIANGVILPPCKVGQTVWFIGDGKMVETNAEKIILKQGGIYIKLGCNAMYETTCRRRGRKVLKGERL